MYIHMYIYIVQTSQYKESKFHFRAKLLLSNFSSALGISIRHACFFFFLLHFFFSWTSKFIMKKGKKNFFPVPPPYCGHAVQSCSTIITVFFSCTAESMHTVFSHHPRSPPKSRILSWQLISIILLCSRPIVWRWALASPAQNAGKLFFRTSAVATLHGDTWAVVLSR